MKSTTNRRTKRSSTASWSTTARSCIIIIASATILWLLAAWLSWGYSVLNDNDKNGRAAKISSVEKTTEKNTKKIAITLLSQNATVTADVRGNLGDAAVVLTDPNGTDWLKDRWQAASDLHGTEIRGAHWVRLEFAPHIIVGNDNGGSGGTITSIILDWETAYSDDYRIDGLVRVWPPVLPGQPDTVNGAADEQQKAARMMMIPLFDSKQQQQKNDNSNNFKTRSYGQSPGVPQKLPLHIIHEIDMTTMTTGSSSTTIATTTRTTGTTQRTPPPPPMVCYGILLSIRSPFHKGWGVSLWSIQVYGMIATN
jgi:hypothetical protein